MPLDTPYKEPDDIDVGADTAAEPRKNYAEDEMMDTTDETAAEETTDKPEPSRPPSTKPKKPAKTTPPET